MARPAKVPTVASVEPHIDLKAVAPTTVVMASPPGTWPSHLCAPLYSRLAIFVFAANSPIRTNRGMTV